MSHTLLIGLTGVAASGKDTVRESLEEFDVFGFAFADSIRNMIRALITSNGIHEDWMDRRELKEEPIPGLGMSYRHLAQTLGTEWGRSLHPDFWLRMASSYMADMTFKGATQFVVSDVRFKNEAQWVRDHGGVIWRIHRSAAQPVREHVSESEMEGIEADRTIENDGDLFDLHEAVKLAHMDALEAVLQRANEATAI